MVIPPDISIKNGIATLRLSGALQVPDAGRRVTEALMYAREQGIRKLLVTTMDATFAGGPTVASAYFRLQEWARASEGTVRLALVLPEALWEPWRDRVEAIVANSGLIGEIFTNEDAARHWLDGAPSGSDVRTSDLPTS